MQQFDHEKLDVYRLAIEFVALADTVVASLPRGHSSLADQFQRAAASIVLNIAEGAGEYSGQEKARFYRMAKRSATECAAALDVCRARKLVGEPLLDVGRAALLRIVSMLIKLVQSVGERGREEEREESGMGTGTGTGTGGDEAAGTARATAEWCHRRDERA
jgi:four helix bundle protein